MLDGRSFLAALERPRVQIGREIACLAAVLARPNCNHLRLSETPRLPTAPSRCDAEVALDDVGFRRNLVVPSKQILGRDYNEVELARLELVKSKTQKSVC